MAETKKPDAIGDAGAYTNFVSNIGTERDKASHGSFVKKVIPDEQLEAVYQHWLAKRIVNRPASDMLRAGWFFEGIQDNDLLKLKEACKAFNLDGVLLSSLVLSRLYGVCYVLLGTVDGGNLDQPFDLNKLGIGRLEFFTVLKKKHIEADTSKYLSPKEAGGLLKQPEFYKLKLDGKSTQRIHHTRLYKFGHADVVNEEPVSVLQEVYEDLLDHAAVKKATASLVHESKIDVIRTPNLVDKIKEDMKSVAERFLSVGLLKGLNGMIVLDKDEEYDSKSYSFGGLPDLMREFSIQAAGGACKLFCVSSI
ncbi:anti-CBASS protein Acb1 family protein, partial [Acinetobacter baumannii]|uniref:anti-CBASS protein Acb1 family protein n=2 Tax=Acinetobacter baumannii TaxID=470 RepID=UPI0013D0E3D7